MAFELFDPEGELRITAGNLPHWFQPRATYFVTFRTADSLPAEVADLWHRRRNDWLLRHAINVHQTDWKRRLGELPMPQQREFHNAFTDEFLSHLDRGMAPAFCVVQNWRRSLRTA